MKKILVCLFLLVLSATAFSQKPILTREEYLAKSKKQKNTAWIMLGGGASLLLIANFIGNSEKSTFDDAATGVIVGGIGALSMLGSIPLFIASGKNKRKGMSLAFKNEKVPYPNNGGFPQLSCPSLTIKIGL